jgi:hypothetical protein
MRQEFSTIPPARYLCSAALGATTFRFIKIGRNVRYRRADLDRLAGKAHPRNRRNGIGGDNDPTQQKAAPAAAGSG